MKRAGRRSDCPIDFALPTFGDSGLIRRRGTGRGATYALTEKGLDLLPAMLELISWSARYDRRTAAPPEFVARIRRSRAAVMAELRKQLRREHGLEGH